MLGHISFQLTSQSSSGSITACIRDPMMGPATAEGTDEKVDHANVTLTIDELPMVARVERLEAELKEVRAEHQRQLDEVRAEHRRDLDELRQLIRGREAAPDVAVALGAEGEKAGRPDSSYSWLSQLIRRLEAKTDEENDETFELSHSMWDASLLMFCQETADVGHVVTIWSIFVFLLNLLVQATIVAIVVYRVGNNPDIDDGIVADVR